MEAQGRTKQQRVVDQQAERGAERNGHNNTLMHNSTYLKGSGMQHGSVSGDKGGTKPRYAEKSK